MTSRGMRLLPRGDFRCPCRSLYAAAAQPASPEPPVLGGELVLEGGTVIEAELIPTRDDLPPDASPAA